LTTDAPKPGITAETEHPDMVSHIDAARMYQDAEPRPRSRRLNSDKFDRQNTDAVLATPYYIEKFSL
jgi:hypothetical protein